jgi:hypothetical protein
MSESRKIDGDQELKVAEVTEKRVPLMKRALTTLGKVLRKSREASKGHLVVFQA